MSTFSIHDWIVLAETHRPCLQSKGVFGPRLAIPSLVDLPEGSDEPGKNLAQLLRRPPFETFGLRRNGLDLRKEPRRNRPARSMHSVRLSFRRLLRSLKHVDLRRRSVQRLEDVVAKPAEFAIHTPATLRGWLQNAFSGHHAPHLLHNPPDGSLLSRSQAQLGRSPRRDHVDEASPHGQGPGLFKQQ